MYLLFKVIDDQRTITGKNINSVLKQTNEDDIFHINVKKLKHNYKFCEQPDDSNWKIDTIKELTSIKLNLLYVNFEDGTELTSAEIDNLINFVATS